MTVTPSGALRGQIKNDPSKTHPKAQNQNRNRFAPGALRAAWRDSFVVDIRHSAVMATINITNPMLAIPHIARGANEFLAHSGAYPLNRHKFNRVTVVV